MSTAETTGIAIVTGGGRGIGREITRTLAAAGTHVAVLARTEEQLHETVTLIEREGNLAVPFAVDVTDQKQLQRVVADVERQLGTVALLVNNAGVVGPSGHIWEDDVDADGWWRCLDVNLRGPFLCARAVLPGMVQHRRGRIINVASGAGLTGLAMMSAYGTSRTALIRLSETLALDLADSGVSVFAIGPGLVRTAMALGLVESGADEKWHGGTFAKRLEEGRDVPPERAARLVLELASGAADALSGLYLDINDDLGDLVGRMDEIREKKLYLLRLQRLA